MPSGTTSPPARSGGAAPSSIPAHRPPQGRRAPRSSNADGRCRPSTRSRDLGIGCTSAHQLRRSQSSRRDAHHALVLAQPADVSNSWTPRSHQQAKAIGATTKRRSRRDRDDQPDAPLRRGRHQTLPTPLSSRFSVVPGRPAGGVAAGQLGSAPLQLQPLDRRHQQPPPWTGMTIIPFFEHDHPSRVRQSWNPVRRLKPLVSFLVSKSFPNRQTAHHQKFSFFF